MKHVVRHSIYVIQISCKQYYVAVTFVT